MLSSTKNIDGSEKSFIPNQESTQSHIMVGNLQKNSNDITLAYKSTDDDSSLGYSADSSDDGILIEFKKHYNSPNHSPRLFRNRYLFDIVSEKLSDDKNVYSKKLKK